MAASTRPDAPSFARMFPTCTATVRSLMKSRWAISRLVQPSASTPSTSRSRGLRLNGSEGATAGSGARRCARPGE